MKKFRLTLITEHQRTSSKAQKLATLIHEIVGGDTHSEISKYTKLTDSFKIEIVGEIDNEANFVEESLKLTDRICSPWTVWLDQDRHEITLVFNKTDYSYFRQHEFNVLRWASYSVE